MAICKSGITIAVPHIEDTVNIYIIDNDASWSDGSETVSADKAILSGSRHWIF